MRTTAITRVLIRIALAATVTLSAAGCGDDAGPGGGGGGSDGGTTGSDGGGKTPGSDLKFSDEQTLDTERAGLYAAISASGSQIGVAYFRELENDVVATCPSTFGQGGGPKKRPGQNLYYVHFDGSSWGKPHEVAQTVGQPYGLSVVLDKSGKPHVGYLGGAMSAQECSSSDAVIATSSNKGASWTKKTVYAKGSTGDTVGHWMSVALDSSGTVHAAYRDVHYGYYEKDGNARADLRYGSSGESISMGKGDGLYNSLLFASGNKPVVAFYNPGVNTAATGGIKLAVKDGSWKISQLVSGSTTETPGFATDGKGLFALTYYKKNQAALYYIESKDLKSWSKPKLVDYSTTNHGQYSSLAFDSKGNPAVAYYRCSDAGASKCDASKDGLMLAYRLNGKWKTWEVDTGGSQYCGRYSTLAFNTKDEPVIAYQCVEIDNKTNSFIAQLKVVRGAWKK